MNRMTSEYTDFLKREEAKGAIEALREKGGPDDKIFQIIQKVYGFDDESMYELMGMEKPKKEVQKAKGKRNASHGLRANLPMRMLRKEKRRW